MNDGGTTRPLPTVGGISPDFNSLPGVQAYHVRRLRDVYGLTAETIIASRITTETNAQKIGSILNRKIGVNKLVPALVIPFQFPDGNNTFCRVRPDVTPLIGGKPAKYLTPSGTKGNRVYFPPGVLPYLRDVTAELLIVEGELKALAATQHGFPTVGLVGVNSWNVAKEKRLSPDLEGIAWQGREVRVVFDSDIARKPGVSLAESWLSAMLVNRGAKVRCVRLPEGPVDSTGEPSKVGVDDFLLAQGPSAKAALRKLLDEAIEPIPVDPASIKKPAASIDPAPEAKTFFKSVEYSGVNRLRFHRGAFYYWTGGRHVELEATEARDLLIYDLNTRYSHLNGGIVSNVLEQVRAACRLPSIQEPPFWIDDAPKKWSDPAALLLAKNGIVNLAAVESGDEKQFLLPATPRLFAFNAIPCEFNVKATEPVEWIGFLNQIWDGDAASINTLQEAMGYTLTADTSQQKMFGVFGPPRSGKGTILRVWQGVIGEHNCASPTLSGLAGGFGLQPLYGKSVAFISDARLGGRTDIAIVVERLLRISGEDSVDIDRKYLCTVTCKLPTRMVLVSNEIPRLADTSGALASRFINLRLVHSYLGREDVTLTKRLLTEREGILIWMYRGWRRLRERGHFVQPDSSKGLRETMETLGSPVKAFANQRCIIGPTYRVPCETLYHAWRKWVVEQGERDTSAEMFGRDLLTALPQIERKRVREDDYRTYCYVGMSLLSDTSLPPRNEGEF